MQKFIPFVVGIYCFFKVTADAFLYLIIKLFILMISLDHSHTKDNVTWAYLHKGDKNILITFRRWKKKKSNKIINLLEELY